MANLLRVVRAALQHAVLPVPLTVNYGTDAWFIEIEWALDSAPTGNSTVIGQNTLTGGNSVYFTTSGRFQVSADGSTVFFSNGSYGLFDGTFHKYRIEHDAGGAIRFYRDGVLFQSGTYAGPAFTSTTLNTFFRPNSSNVASGFTQGRFKYLEVGGFGAGSGRWDANDVDANATTLPCSNTSNNAQLVNFTADSVVSYDPAISKVGAGWLANEADYISFKVWADLKAQSAVYETALCKGDLDNASRALAPSDFPNGALISGVVPYVGNNHMELAWFRARGDFFPTSGNLTVENLRFTYSAAAQYTVSVQNGNLIRNCYIEHSADPGSNASILNASLDGRAENCVVRGLLSTASKAIRPSDRGIVRNCVAVGTKHALLSEWTTSKTERSYGVGASVSSCWWPNGRPAGNITNASEDGTGDVGYQNLTPEANLVDYLNGDFRVRINSPLYAAGIGAFFVPTEVAVTKPLTNVVAGLGRAYSLNLDSYFDSVITYSIISGSLPAGLSLVENKIVGTPTAVQTTTCVIRASNDTGFIDSSTITFKVGLWRLNYIPVSGKYISTPVIDIPTGSSYEIEFQYSFDDSGRARVAGSSNASANNIWIEPSSVSETLTLTSSAGAPRNFTLTGLVRSENNIFRIVRTGASTTELFVNEISQGVVSLAGSFAFTRFFISASTTATSATCNLTYFKVSVGGTLIVNYDATASGGTGDILPELVSALNGTQEGTWPADDGEWIDYAPAGGTDEFTASIVSSYPIYSANIVTSVTKPDYTASIVVSYAGYTANVISTNTKPIKAASVVSTYPSYTASINATGGVSTYTVSVNTTYPKYTANVAVADVNKLSISTSYPAYTSNVTSTNIKPIKTASVVGTYAKYTASVVATKVSVEKTLSVNTTYPVYGASSVLTNIDPIRSVSVNASYSKYGVTCTLTNVDPINSLNINSTYPKYSASINAGTLIQDRTLTIVSSYPTYIASVVIGDFVTLPYIGGKGAHLVISLGSRDVIIKDKSRNVKWRVENARL